MAVTLLSPNHRASTNLFRPLEIGEPIPVLVATFQLSLDLGQCFRELKLRRLRRLTLVVHVPLTFPPLELAGFLDLSTGFARRVVLTTSSGAPHQQTSLAADDLRAECQREWPCLVQFEPDPERAIIGAMQSLGEGEAFAILWPDDSGLVDPAALVAQGARWRSSWEGPEDGEFHWLSPRTDSY